MLSVCMLPAGRGDFFIIEYGDDQENHSVFIDGGDASGMAVYKKILTYYYTQKKIIDALIFTHIDDDHIAGALSAISSMKQLPEIQKIYLNTGKGTADRLGISAVSDFPEQEERSYIHVGHKQHTVHRALSLLDLLKEKGLADKIADTLCLGDSLSIGAAALKIISPGEKQLQRYLKQWNKEEKKLGLQHAGKYRKLMGNLCTYADKVVKEDTSPSNGSSIAFLFEYEGKRLAFLADAFPSVCMEGILKFYPSGTCTDFVKIPHHGSSHNYSKELYTLLGTDHFLLSTNGKGQGKTQHPDPEFLGKLFRQFPKAQIYCNINWMKDYGFADDDRKRYLNMGNPQIIYLKDDIILPSGLIIRGTYRR